MSRLPRSIPWILLCGTVFVLVGVVGWWVLRWQVGLEVFGAAQAYLHDELGLSQAQSTVVGVGAGIAGAFLLTCLAVSRRVLVGTGVVGLTLGLPAAFLHDWLAAGRCFGATAAKPLCSVWQTPEGNRAIRREDGPRPPTGWRRLGFANEDDVAFYSFTPEEQLARRPKRLMFETCANAPAFFEAGRARVYFARGLNDEIDLWDRPGAHEQTNAPLREVTPAVVAQVCKTLDDIARKKADEAEREARLRAEQEALQQASARETEARERAEEARRQAEEQAKTNTSEEVRRSEDERAAARIGAEATAQQHDSTGARAYAAAPVASGPNGYSFAGQPDEPRQPTAAGVDPVYRVRIR